LTDLPVTHSVIISDNEDRRGRNCISEARSLDWMYPELVASCTNS